MVKNSAPDVVVQDFGDLGGGDVDGFLHVDLLGVVVGEVLGEGDVVVLFFVHCGTPLVEDGLGVAICILNQQIEVRSAEHVLIVELDKYMLCTYFGVFAHEDKPFM